MKEQDISKMPLNNKNTNINFLMKPSIFEHLMNIASATTDTSKAYIPLADYKHFYTDKNNHIQEIEYQSPNQTNNYSDLSVIINKDKQIHFKACRVKTLSAINMMGNVITWNEQAISENHYIVFYSINPNDMGKILVMTTQMYADFFVSNNDNINIKYFNAYNTDKIKEKMKFNDKAISFIDYSVPTDLDDISIENIVHKYYYCYKSLLEHNDNPKMLLKLRTHYGNQYTAYNFKTKEIVNFRDCIARNNFFKLKGIKLANNNVINRNCDNMNKLVNGDELEKYQVNVLENSGWIIMNYIPNEEDVYYFVQTLIHKLIIFSKKWKKRLSEYVRKIDDLINDILRKLSEFKNKVHKLFTCFRPITLYDFVARTEDVTLERYFKNFPLIKKRFKI